MLKEFLSLLYNLPIFKSALTKSKIAGLSGCLISIYVRAIVEKYSKAIVITETPIRLARLFSPFIEAPAVAHIDAIPPPNAGDIINLLSKIHSPNFLGICNYIKDIESPNTFFSRMVHLQSSISPSALVKKLTMSNYKRAGTVCEVGEFAIRGGILDIFPQAFMNPVRIEFFGDEIVSIRKFDVYTQRSTGEIQNVSIPPNNIFPGSSSIMDYLLPDIPVVSDIDSLDAKNVIHIAKDGFCIDSEPSYVGNLSLFRERIKELQDYRIFISCEPHMRREIEELFPNTLVIPVDLVEGFILKKDKIAVFSTEDIFGVRRHQTRWVRPRSGMPIEDLEEITKGDYVVHSDFGTGIYDGIKKINIDGVATDCILIKYRNEDKLYVPISLFKCVEKFIGDEGAPPPQLSSLGGDEWSVRKQKAREDIEKIMKELLLLYAERNVAKGYPFSPDTVWQKELEASFPYEETLDQTKVMEEVKRDMENDTPVDRLVCGDVGFGKTEIAIRASMKAVMDGKQVGVLVPTTILAEQHLETFKKRIGNFPVRIEQLSSFVTGGKATALKRDISEGKVDIIIGTHALLRGKVVWKDLGLLIIDEEHRFGVRDKEKIKMIKKGVDVLSLSATPIPRTLFQSLQGIKNISYLSTPPQGRLQIVTKVIKWNDEEIINAINIELERGGQVYFVHNEIKTIMEMKDTLMRMTPNARISVVHGRLPKRRLEKRMLEFLLGDADILLTTAIIGSGIDITNVNTIIINRANRFGLADLHQLRGRVGRGDRRAYCYLITDSNASLVSMRRLKAVANFTELGAGIRLAMKDLEIRGAGNLLGAEQHGHAKNIGYGLYLRLLEETAKRLKGEKMEEIHEPIIDIRLPAYFPDFYVDGEHKIGLYKRLGRINTPCALSDFIAELKDRFGPLPKEVENLITITEIKIMAQRLGVSRIKRDGVFLIEWDNKLKKRIQIKERTEKRYDFGINVGKEATVISLSSDIGELKSFLESISIAE